jgi:hypothetical protein
MLISLNLFFREIPIIELFNLQNECLSIIRFTLKGF